MTLFGALVAAVAGAFLASFAGVIAERLSTGDSWMRGRSRCNACGRTLSTIDLVPVLSYLVQGGRCRSCGARIPVRYTLAEIALALAFFSAVLTIRNIPALLVLLILLFLLLVIVLYDLRHTIIPMPLALALVMGAAGYAALMHVDAMRFGGDLFVAGLIGSGFFLLYALSRARAMGLGDSPVALALSLIAGDRAILGLMYSFWIGAVIGIIILVRERGGPRMGIEVPFVPFLAVGYLLALFLPWNPLPF